MADTILTDLTAISVPALTDVAYLVDVSDTTDDAAGSSRQVVLNRLLAVLNPGIINGRLTLESGVPISSSDQTAKTNLYFTPYNGNRIGVYDGTRWIVYSFSEITLALGTLTSDKNYDVYIYDNAGTLTLELTAWTDDTTRATALTTQDGIYVKTGATTRRWLGTIRTTSTTTTEDSITKRFVANAYNTVERGLLKTDATSHAYNSATYRYWNNDSTQKMEFVLARAQCVAQEVFVSVTSASYWVVGLQADWTSGSVSDADAWMYSTLTGADIALGSSRFRETAEGYHFLAVTESTGANITFGKYKASCRISC